MKQMLTITRILLVTALAAVTVSCTSDLQNKENLAVAAGFKVITPTKPNHQAMLAKLPPDKVTKVNFKGKSYYVLPDAKNNQAYVGGAKEYQSYQQLRLQKQMSNENLEAAEMNQEASMDWNAWGGWGMVGPMGFR